MGRPSLRRAPTLRGFALVALVAVGACGPLPAPSVAPPPARPLSPAEIEAVAALLQVEDERRFAEPVLRAAAVSPSPRVRRQAALALARLRRVEGFPLLAPLLSDPDSSVAATAAFALGQIGDTAAVPALASLLEDTVLRSRPTVASEAAYALSKARSAAGLRALDRLLASADERAAEPVGSALLAAWRFPRPADLEPILRWTRSGDPGLRWRAAYALTRRPTPAATPVLLRLARDPDARVRAFAVRGLSAPLADSSGVGAAAALPVLLEAAQDSAYEVHINALRALGTHRDPAAVRRLASLLSAVGRHSALAAAEALGRVGPAAAAAGPRLEALAGSDSVHVALRQEALAALSRVDPPAAARLARALADSPQWRLRSAAARALAAAEPGTSAPLDGLLRDRDGRVAAAALQAALDATGDSVRPLRARLLEALGSADVWVRATALGGLARLGDPASLPALLDAYDRARADPLNDAALAAIDAIAAVHARGAPPWRAFFARFPRSPDALVRLRARERFGAAADSAWGDPLPLDTGRSPADYLEIARRWLALPVGSDAGPVVEIETDAGRLLLRLSAADAPLTVESLLSLAARGYFDGQEWPRVVPNFVIQGGDPRGDTNGGPGYNLRDEINRHRYETGSLGMALSGPDTGGSQFFVTHSAQPHLDGIYTIFGELLEGQDVARAILPGDRIRTIRIAP
jgi:cyclophilin family peptidyl-prolyl cis-trans isomerase/HEAT repeat protein